MKVLHISGDFIATNVHKNLYKELDNKLEQIIYSPIRNSKLFGSNKFESNGTEFIYSLIVKQWYKYAFFYKSSIINKDIENKVNFENVDLIHATTLFSDGIQAYKIYKKYKIPYVVAVRNTDVNGFAKLLPHTWPIAKKILLNAEKIYFISKALQEKFEQKSFVKGILNDIKHKFVFRPNGIDIKWLNSIDNTSRSGKQILYIGNFSNNKNVVRLINAIILLKKEKEYNDVKLTIIGGGDDNNNNVTNLINTNNNFIQYLGKIYDIAIIKHIMKEHALFAMPSIHETFGLVYIEALSQNLPIVYTKGQGVDKLFDEDNDLVGIAVNPHSTENIKNAIKEILTNKDKYSNKQVDFSLFDWKNIAIDYFNDYKNIIKSK